MAKTRSLLIVHSGYPEAMNFFMPDSGLASLAGCLLDAGHRTEVLDFNTPATLRRLVRPDRPDNLGELIRDHKYAELRAMLEGDQAHQLQVFEETAAEVARKVKREGVHWVGFKLWSGDSLSASHAMARKIKEDCPGVKTIAGGPQVDRLQDLILSEFPAFDFASVREGEPCIVPFAEHVAGERRKLEEVPNLLYRRGHGVAVTGSARVVDLDALPLPRYDEAVYPSMADGKLKVLCFEESRGCRNRCGFCTHRSKAGHLRVKRPERVTADLEELLRRTGCPAFRLSGSYTPGAILQQIADHFLQDRFFQNQHRPLWTTFGHVKGSGDVDFRRIREAGCVALLFGVESGSQRILDEVLHKGIRVEQIRRTLTAVRQAGIKVLASLIYPNHTETEQTRQQTLDLLKETRPYSALTLFPGLFPGSRWWEDPECYGFKVEDLEAYRRSLLGFKVRLFLPIEMWDLLEIELDGKEPKRVVDEYLEFSVAVRALGIRTGVPDEVVLFASILDQDPVVLRDQIFHSFLRGDSDYLEETVKTINQATTCPVLPGSGSRQAWNPG